MPPSLAELEELLDRAGISEAAEAAMPKGGRPRQLPVRTLLLGTLLALADSRPAHLRRVHGALVGLSETDRVRLGVLAPTRSGPHELTYRQVEHTFATFVASMDPTPVPSFAGLAPSERAAHLEAERAPVDAETCEARLRALGEALLEASVPEAAKEASTSVAVDWSDYSSWSRPVETGEVAVDADASWGHRRPNAPGARHEVFFGYYLQAVTMVPEERGPAVAELVRRVVLEPCRVDPPVALVPTLERMAASGIALGDVLADSGYSHRTVEHWAAPLHRLGAHLVQDLHPHDRGRKGTHQGAVCANGRLYCPATPARLLDLAPLPPGAPAAETAAHDLLSAELARYKLAPVAGPDADGYLRVACPAAAGKLRCPLKASSLALGFDRPEVLCPPSGPSAPCCAQTTITVPPTVNAKTRQKHDYPSTAHRLSYARRTGVERSFATLKDPASTDIRRGWCRLLGRSKNLIMLICAVAVRNLRVLASFDRRAAKSAEERAGTRKRRRPS